MIKAFQFALLAVTLTAPVAVHWQLRIQDEPASHTNVSMPISTPAPGAVVPPPRIRLLGAGISGPGTVIGPTWAKVNQKVTGSAVKEGLLPPLKALLNVK